MELSAEEDWFDVDQGYYLSASFGHFDDGANTRNVLMAVPFPLSSELVVQYGELRSDFDVENNLEVSFQSDAEQVLSAGFSYEQIETDSGYELEEITLNAVIALGRWETQLRLSQADVNFSVTGLDDAVLEQRIQDLALLKARRDHLGFSVAYYRDNWGARFNFDDYELERARNLDNFERDDLLTGLSPRQRLDLYRYLSELSDERPLATLYRSVLFANFGYGQQVSVTADYSASVDAFFWDAYANTYSFGLLHLDQKQENSRRLQAYIAGDFPLGKQFSLGLLLSGEDNDSSVYSQLSIGYGW